MDSPLSPEEDNDNESFIHQSEKNSIANGNDDDNHSGDEGDELGRETPREEEPKIMVSLQSQECVAKGNNQGGRHLFYS